MLIIITALFLFQFIIFLTATLLFNTGMAKERNENFMPTVIEDKWHEQASNLENDQKKINDFFARWKEQYPDSSMFWINEKGTLQLQLDLEENVPSNWTATTTARFIKERYDSDPFTVIAFVGKEEKEGFVVFEIPRDKLNKEFYEEYGDLLLGIGVIILILFIAISFLFFRSIQKRLIYVQEAMEIRDTDHLPVQIDVKKQDEIGQLELTFNKMVDELKKSKRREQEEEQLRRKLIANLSHDLRTPLTKLQANLSILQNEDQTEVGRQIIQVMEDSIQSVDGLMDNLISYTLLTASKYKYSPEKVDMIRFLRTSLASWYPLFEQEQFEVDIQLDSVKIGEWYVDPLWMERILDNLFQNVLRHAKSGRYIGVRIDTTSTYEVIVMTDHGKGMKHDSDEKGAGIGLSIVDVMIRGLDLEWELASTENGTTIQIKKHI